MIFKLKTIKSILEMQLILCDHNPPFLREAKMINEGFKTIFNLYKSYSKDMKDPKNSIVIKIFLTIGFILSHATILTFIFCFFT